MMSTWYNRGLIGLLQLIVILEIIFGLSCASVWKSETPNIRACQRPDGKYRIVFEWIFESTEDFTSIVVQEDASNVFGAAPSGLTSSPVPDYDTGLYCNSDWSPIDPSYNISGVNSNVATCASMIMTRTRDKSADENDVESFTCVVSIPSDPLASTLTTVFYGDSCSASEYGMPNILFKDVITDTSNNITTVDDEFELKVDMPSTVRAVDITIDEISKVSCYSGETSCNTTLSAGNYPNKYAKVRLTWQITGFENQPDPHTFLIFFEGTSDAACIAAIIFGILLIGCCGFHVCVSIYILHFKKDTQNKVVQKYIKESGSSVFKAREPELLYLLGELLGLVLLVIQIIPFGVMLGTESQTTCLAAIIISVVGFVLFVIMFALFLVVTCVQAGGDLRYESDKPHESSRCHTPATVTNVNLVPPIKSTPTDSPDSKNNTPKTNQVTPENGKHNGQM